MANKEIVMAIRIDEKMNEVIETIAKNKDLKKSELVRVYLEAGIKKDKKYKG